MGDVEITGSVRIGNRTFKLRKSPLFFSAMGKSFVEATKIQLRILAYSAKDYLIDKLLAQTTQHGKLQVERDSGRLRQEEEPPEEQPKDIENRIFERVVRLPARHSDPAKVERAPFRMDPLSPAWVTRKIRKNLDPRTLIATGDYLRGIVVRRRVDPANKKETHYVIEMANRDHVFAKVPLNKLALIHEFGTASYTVALFGDPNRRITIKIPERPHWRPTYQFLLDEMKKLGPEVNARIMRLAIQNLV